MSAFRGVVVVVEHDGDRILSHLETLAAAACRVADGNDQKVCAVLVGRRVARLAAEVAAATGWDVTGIENDALILFNTEQHKAVLAQYFACRTPEWLFMAHSAAAQELAPALAMRLGGGCVTGVQAAAAEDGRVVLKRPVFGGKLVATVVPEVRPVVVTLLPGAGGDAVPPPAAPGRVEVITAACPPVAARVIGRRSAETTGAAITEARTIVAAGNGIGSREQLDMVSALARCFPRSAVAGSRPVCDRGWLPHSFQVGLTGTTVRPDLYIACGISGAFQHVAGIREAGFIAAINRDPQAAIFQVADVGIVADLAEFLPVLIEVLGENRKEALNHEGHEEHEGEKTENGDE
ncbi:MAG: electron transfer flavoprotein subunit alpha/FixB family protein [Pseudomonadota bacterium]